MADEKESDGAIKDLWKDLRLSFHERLSNPLIGSFVISWLVWNHRMLTVLFSSKTVEERFAYIDTTLYPNWQSALGHNLLGPLACALAYIFIYPYPAKWVNGFWLRRENERKKQRDEIEGGMLLTQKESEEIRMQAAWRVR